MMWVTDLIERYEIQRIGLFGFGMTNTFWVLFIAQGTKGQWHAWSPSPL